MMKNSKRKNKSHGIFFSKPSGLIKALRAITAVTVMTAAVSLPAAAMNFPDCDATENLSLINAADVLSILGVIKGYPDGNFMPEAHMSRAEMAAIIGRLIQSSADVTDDTGFTDIDSSCFASGYIKDLSEKNILNGTGNGLFSPNETVTYNEFIKTVVKLIENYNGANINHDYPSGYIEAAKEYGIIADDYTDDTNSAITRGAAAIILYNTLYVPLGESPNPTTNPTTNPTVTQAPVTGVNAFAMKMNNQMNSDENYMFSPLSIKMALAMTANGSADETKNEIISVLGIDNLDEYNNTAKKLIESYNTFDFDYKTYNDLTDKINSGESSDEEFKKWRDMYSELNKNEKAYLSIANSIWVNKDYKNEYGYKPSFNPEFEKIIRESYDGTSEVVDNSNAVEKINKWTSDKTNGKIPSIINDSDFLAALVNAIYFNGKWENKFYEYRTKPDVFHNADGTITQTDFMNITTYFDYYADSDVNMIKLPYKGRNAAMYISIDNGKISNYDTYFDKLESARVNISIPKFKIEYSKELNDLLGQLGINRAFSKDAAQFPNICDGIPTGENVYIDKVIHKTYIDVDENGTEAAAVTAVIAAGAASIITDEPIEFKADKPFTFIIRDESSGEIIFMGRLANM